MKALKAPAIDYSDLYAEAVGQTKKNLDKATLRGLSAKILAAGNGYGTSMDAHGPHAVKALALSDPERKLVGGLYEKRLVSKSGSCRWAYEKILTSSAFCPYCEWGETYEVDHFLPQSEFACLNICPSNLVPICHACNHIKWTLTPQGQGKYLVHPYFDTLPKTPWLFAKLESFARGNVLRYWVDLDHGAHGDLSHRLAFQFDKLQLDRRMRERSSKVLAELEMDVEQLQDKVGTAGVQMHFREAASKAFDLHGNTLEAAAYRAASEDADFCSGDSKN